MKNNSEGLICAKLVGSCLTAAVYFIIFLQYSRSVHPCIERHVGVRSTAVAKANISRESKVGNVLEWCSHPMSKKTKGKKPQ